MHGSEAFELRATRVEVQLYFQSLSEECEVCHLGIMFVPRGCSLHGAIAKLEFCAQQVRPPRIVHSYLLPIMEARGSKSNILTVASINIP